MNKDICQNDQKSRQWLLYCWPKQIAYLDTDRFLLHPALISILIYSAIVGFHHVSHQFQVEQINKGPTGAVMRVCWALRCEKKKNPVEIRIKKSSLTEQSGGPSDSHMQSSSYMLHVMPFVWLCTVTECKTNLSIFFKCRHTSRSTEDTSFIGWNISGDQ